MTSIGQSVIITGDVTSDEDLLIEGRVRGHIHLRDGMVTIGEQGRVEADVRGARVLIRGTVRGTITASERIELAATAVVEGNLSANRIVIAEGARFSGSVDMGQRTIAAKVAQYKAAQAAVS